MRNFLLAVAAVSAIAAAAPASAQYSQAWNNRSESVERRLDQLRLRIDEGVRRGSISRREAVQLNSQLWQLRRIEDQYDNGGINGRERQDLERRLYALRDQLNRAEGGRRGYGGNQRDWSYGDDRYGGGVYGEGPGYDLDRQWDEQVYDSDRDGYDDRDRDRDGSWQDDRAYPGQNYPGQSYPGQSYPGGSYPGGNYPGQSYPSEPYPGQSYPGQDYPEPDYPGGGYDADGGYYDNGAPADPRVDDDEWRGDGREAEGGYSPVDARGPVGVGDPAPQDLSALPPEYRGRYPDGNGVYYRYDDGRVYQIEQRTGTIRWIGELPR